jgi:cysteinyl-tRNA synthetase
MSMLYTQQIGLCLKKDVPMSRTTWLRMIEQHRLAKANKDYARADAIRHDLAT